MTYTRTRRSEKAQNQARDRFGRWVSVGANVRWNTNGVDFAGTIDSIDDGDAKITVKHPDGTESQTSIKMTRLRVLASKATLPDDASTFHDKGNNFTKALENPEILEAYNKNKSVAIERADGYKLNLSEKKPKDTGNPIIFQLFAPGGRSLGQYDESAKGDFDNMVTEDRGETTPEDRDTGDVVVASAEARPYAVPSQVKEDVSQALSTNPDQFSVEDLAIAQRLSKDGHVSRSDVEWVHSFFSSTELSEKLHGGFKGKKWSSSIVNPVVKSDPKVYAFSDENLEYFATSDTEGSTEATALFAVDREADRVFAWHNEFTWISELSVESFEAPEIMEIGVVDAETLASIFDSGTSSFNILDLDVEERTLFALALPEMDFGQLDQATAIIADATGYSPLERSVNAKKQRRAGGGMFGKQADKAPIVQEEAPLRVQKATLPPGMPLVGNVAQRITDWLESASEAPVMASGEPAVGTDIEDLATGPTDEAIYFAIVDDVDQTAVLDAVAIVKVQGAPSAFLRQQAQWVSSPDSLADFQGTTPPPVVEMQSPEPVKTVLMQIDTHDAEQPIEEAPIAASAGFSLPDGSLLVLSAEDLSNAVLEVGNPTLQQKQHLRKRAFAFNRMDLIPEGWRTLTLGERGEIGASQTLYGEFGEILPMLAGGVPGVADTAGDWKSAQRLKAYWTHGRGAAKIRWGTPGDLTRAHSHLEKYVPGRGWALANSYHKYLMGVSNITHDRATGQYRPRRRK